MDKVAEEQLARWQTGFGRINPFLRTDTPILQLFDQSLQIESHSGDTVVTNASEWTWAIEFIPTELVTKLPDAHWADIARTQEKPQQSGALHGV